jgi:hypothetical protein
MGSKKTEFRSQESAISSLHQPSAFNQQKGLHIYEDEVKRGRVIAAVVKYTIDTSFVIKGLIPHRRKQQDDVFERVGTEFLTSWLNV